MSGRAFFFIFLLLLAFVLPITHTCALPPSSRPFVFARDTFAYENELSWVYQIDPATGRMTPRKRHPKPEYRLRCFVAVRAARQFHHHARFEAREPKATAAMYRHLVRLVYGRSPRRQSEDNVRIVIPGYASLREFSRDHEALLKQESGAAWQSFLQRGNWRMVFPFSRRHQARTAEHLWREVRRGRAPIVHLVTFPSLALNHALLVFDAEVSASGWRFLAYDPNEMEQATPLMYQREERRFSFPASPYFAGGPVNVYEVYQGLFY